jgi:hypothetical protein
VVHLVLLAQHALFWRIAKAIDRKLAHLFFEAS